MSIELITGNSGGDHISSADLGGLNIGVVGPDDYVLTGMSASKINNNTVRVSDGEAVMQGRHFRIGSGGDEDVTIENGATGYYRSDIIVAKYAKGTTETVTLDVIKGTPSTGTPSDPTVTEGDIPAGDTAHEMALFRVNISEFTIDSIDILYSKVLSIADIISGVQPVGTLAQYIATITKASNATYASGSDLTFSITHSGGSDDYIELQSNNYDFKALKAGVYLISGTVRLSVATTGNYISLYLDKNGSTLHCFGTVENSASQQFFNVTTLIYLGVDHYFSLKATTEGGVNFDLISAYTRFSIIPLMVAS